MILDSETKAVELPGDHGDELRLWLRLLTCARMIEADMAFHAFIYELAENPLIAPAMDTHWTNTQRVMGEVLMRDERPRDIWDQHEALLAAVVAGDGRKAEKLARQHIELAANFMIERLRREAAPA